MVHDSDPLVRIQVEEWPRIAEVIRKDFPRGILPYNWVKTMMNWSKLEPETTPFYIFSPNGNFKKGLVTYGRVGKKAIYMTVYTFNNDLRELREALLKTSKIPWCEELICGVPKEHANWFEEVMDQMGHPVHYNLPTHYYNVPKETAQKYCINCPPDVYIERLKQSDIPLINSLWPHNFEGSDVYLSNILRISFGYGVYSKTDDSLLSWALQYEYGDVAVLQTRPDQTRKGYAKLVVQATSKHIAENGEDPYLYIVVGNEPSEKLAASLDFKYAGSYNWLEYNYRK